MSEMGLAGFAGSSEARPSIQKLAALQLDGVSRDKGTTELICVIYSLIDACASFK